MDTTRFKELNNELTRMVGVIIEKYEAEQMKDDFFFKEEIINKGKVLFSAGQQMA